MTHVRDTSIEAYNKIRQEGLLSKLRLLVYEALFNYGPMTQRETYESLVRRGHDIREYSIRPRFVEMIDMEVIKETGTRLCKFSQTNSIEYDVTSNLPKKPEADTKKPRHIDPKELKLFMADIGVGYIHRIQIEKHWNIS